MEDSSLYLLQPRTYTPQPPEPAPSLRAVEDPAVEQVTRVHELQGSTPDDQYKRTSLRQRVSLKGGNLPEVIQVPSRSAPELQAPRYPSSRNQSPVVPDSAYESGLEVVQPPSQPVADSYEGMPPPRFPNHVPSPLSDQQHFYPVRASPHSPLQQRPWTSATNTRPHTSLSHTGPRHLRNQPSAMGMSMLSNVETIDSATKAMKKKRSAFGWLKKAFALDEEERAQFEARKQQQTPTYYHQNNAHSPRFLDGRRLPDPPRPHR